MTQKEIRTLFSYVTLLQISPSDQHRDASGLLALCLGVRLINMQAEIVSTSQVSVRIERREGNSEVCAGSGVGASSTHQDFGAELISHLQDAFMLCTS